MKNAVKAAMINLALATSLCGIAAAQAQIPVPKKSNIPARLKKDAKISVEQARSTAVTKVPGDIQEEELENEHGRLVYSFDIRAVGQKDITEVQVSAIDGSIVSVEKEDAASEAKQKQQEAGKPKP